MGGTGCMFMLLAASVALAGGTEWEGTHYMKLLMPLLKEPEWPNAL